LRSDIRLGCWALGIRAEGVITLYGQMTRAVKQFCLRPMLPAPGPSNKSLSNIPVRARRGIQDHLTIVMKRWPPIPRCTVLIRSTTRMATGIILWLEYFLSGGTYTLEEETMRALPPDGRVQSRLWNSWAASGNRLERTYYYRVKATNAWGDSAGATSVSPNDAR